MPVDEKTSFKAGSTLGLTRIEAERLVVAARGRCGGEDFVPANKERQTKNEKERESGKQDREKDKDNVVVDSIILRFSEIYGSLVGDKAGGRITRFITRLVHAAIQHVVIHFANKDKVLDLLHVRDAVHAILLSISLLDQRQDNSNNQPNCDFDFNIASGFVPSVGFSSFFSCSSFLSSSFSLFVLCS